MKVRYTSVAVLGIMLVVVGAGSGALSRVWRTTAAARLVKLEPSIVELVEPVQEGETPKVPLVIRNFSARVVTVDRVSSSCGCMEVVTKGNKPVQQPIDIEPGGSLPLRVTLSAKGRTGEHEFAVAVDGFVAGSPRCRFETISTMRVVIRAGLRIEPAAFVLPSLPGESQAVASATILDGQDGKGIEVDRIEMSDDMMVGTLTRLPDRDQTRSLATGLTPRYRLDVTVAVPKDREYYEGYVELIPVDPQQPPTRAPVRWHAPPGRVELFPRKLVVEATQLGQKLRRTVMCIVNDSTLGDLSIANAPAGLHARLEPVSNGKAMLHIECTVSRDADCGDFEVVLTSSTSTSPVVVLPVQIRMGMNGNDGAVSVARE